MKTLKEITAGKRNAIAFMRKWYEAIEELSDKDRLTVYDEIMREAFYGEVNDLKGITASVMSLIRPSIQKMAVEDDYTMNEDVKAQFETSWKAYRRKGNKKVAMAYWSKMTDAEREMALKHIPHYVESRDMSYQKDYERYLRDKVFTSVVISNNGVSYDPIMNTNGTYAPHGLGIYYDENKKAFVSIDAFYGVVYDGYTDDDRPNGATIVLNNARGVISWDCETKIWRQV